jgi:hypothetical protein
MKMNIDRTSEKTYRLCLACLSDEELSREMWLMDEHIRYLHKEDLQSAIKFSSLLEIAQEEKNRRAYNRGYV